MPHMQWPGKSTYFSTNQWIGHSIISWSSGNWIYELQQNHIRTYSINQKCLQYDIIKDSLKKFKIEIKKSIGEKYKNVIKRLTTKVNDTEICLGDISTLSRVSNWLTVLPGFEFGFQLSKKQFWDSDMVGETCNLPATCPHGSKLIFSTVWVARKVALYTYGILIYKT